MSTDVSGREIALYMPTTLRSTVFEMLLSRAAILVLLTSGPLAACSGATQAVTTTSSPSVATTVPGVSAGSTATSTTTTGQPGQWVAYLNEILDLIEAHAYYADRVDFPA
jgi:predicted S18 family serine protease